MEKVTDKCTGCRMCEQICQHNAIKMVADKEGFLQAEINHNLCVDCGLCSKRCPQNRTDDLVFDVKETFAARLTNDNTLYKSASGGAFAGLSIAAIKKGWIVYGVAYDGNLVAHHIKATTIEELDPIFSSKYVQSNTEHSFSEVKTLLKDGKKVLYSGTPCQIAGIRSFIGNNNDNLLLVDILCHGVPSPLLFSKHIELLRNKHHGAKISEYDFRDKRGGWGLGYKYKYKYKYKYGNCEENIYYMYFLDGHIYRECCYSCKYAQQRRSGDITIADYWGIENYHPKFYSPKGVSLVLLNTDKGIGAWEHIKNDFDFIESKMEYAAAENFNLCRPTIRVDHIRDHVYEEINSLSVEDYFEKHLPYKEPFKARLKNLLPIKLKLYLKQIIWKFK